MAQTTPKHEGYSIIDGTTTGKNGAKVNTWIEWKETSYSVENNTSTVNVYLYARANTSGLSTKWVPSYSDTYGSIIVNGTTYSGPAFVGGYDFTSTSNYNLMSYKEGIVISHNTDGSKSISISGTWDKGNSTSTYITGGSVSATTVSLTTIPRASSFTLPSSFTTGSAGSVTISRASTNFTHTVTYSIGSNSASVTGATTSASITFPHAWIPNATSATATVTVTTFNGTTQIGSSSKTVTVNVNTSLVPSFTEALSDAGGLVPSSWGIYVQNKSKLKLQVNSATAGSGASISSYSLNAAGTTGTSSSVTSGWLSSATTYSWSATVKDSRGRSTTKSGTKPVVAYFNPYLSNVEVWRANSSGTKSDSGTYIHIKATSNYASCSGKNSATLRYRVKTAGGSYGSYVTLTSGTAVNISSYAATTNYVVELSLYDAFGSSSNPNVIAEYIIPSEERIINVNASGKGLAIGGFSTEPGKLQVYYPADFEGNTLPTINTLPFVAEAKGFALYGGTEIPNNSNLNDDTFMSAGTWICQNNANANTLTNCPTTYVFRMIVLKTLKHLRTEGNGTNWIGSQQIIYDYMGNVYSRYIYYADTDTDKRIGVWYGGLKDNTEVGNLGWNGYRANGVNIPTLNTLAYWNGAYSGTASNLEHFGSNALNNLTNHGTFSGSNVNDCLTLGVWLINPSTTTTNLPYSDWGFLRVERQGNNYIQTFFRLYGQNTFVRIYANDDWRGWRELGNGVDGGTYNWVTATGSNVTLTGSTANDLCTLTVPHRDVWLVEGYCKVTATASANTKVELYLNNYWSNHRVGAWIPYTNTPLYMQYNHIAWGTDIQVQYILHCGIVQMFPYQTSY